ncbi:unnamed protein product [Durusdinium trenchii]|uniref:C3H1-type domain-containing protein n=1 Tax=Durusdinium trenchii TaxID=1381693 RepID=A0ABP0K9I5_9DINO
MQKQETFRYTSLCRFYMAGRCERGEECHFAHDESQLREKPNLYRTRICRSLAKSGKCKASKFAHSQEEMRDYNSGMSASESVEGDTWARTESSWSQDESDMKNSYVPVPWVDQGMNYCGMWPGYGFQVVGWMPSGEMAWMPCQWEGQADETEQKDDAESPKSNDREAEDDSPKSPTIEGVLQWDPIAISKSEGDSALCELSWDPLGLGMTCTTTEGGGGCLDPSVVLLAARTLDKKTTSDCVKRASFYSLPSTAFSETATTDKDDEADSVFEAWAVTEALGSPDDILMHKGVHYEMSVRNTFISFGVAGTAKRKSRAKCLLWRVDATAIPLGAQPE